LPEAIAPINDFGANQRDVDSVAETDLGGKNVIGVACGNEALTVQEGTFGPEDKSRGLRNGDFKWFSDMNEEEKSRITSPEWGGFGQDGKKGIITPNGFIIDMEIALIAVEVNLNRIGKDRDMEDIPLKDQSLAIIRDWRVYPDEAWSLTPGRVQAFLVRSADYEGLEIPKTKTNFGLGFGDLEAFAPNNNVRNFQGMRLRGTITTDPEDEAKKAPGVYMDYYANLVAEYVPKAGEEAPKDGVLAAKFLFDPDSLGDDAIAPTNSKKAKESVVESADSEEFGRNVIGLSCANEGLRVEDGNVNPEQGERTLKRSDFRWFSSLDDETKRLITSNGWTFTGRDSRDLDAFDCQFLSILTY